METSKMTQLKGTPRIKLEDRKEKTAEIKKLIKEKELVWESCQLGQINPAAIG